MRRQIAYKYSRVGWFLPTCTVALNRNKEKLRLIYNQLKVKKKKALISYRGRVDTAKHQAGNLIVRLLSQSRSAMLRSEPWLGKLKTLRCKKETSGWIS